jgi:hypothetical protein
MKTTLSTNQKKSMKSVSYLLNKKSASKSIFTLLLLVLISPLSSFAQNCSVTIAAKNNIESVNKEGRVYFVTLQNNTGEDIALNLSVANYNSEKNPDGTSTKENVKLTASLLNSEGKIMGNKVNLSAKELKAIQVKITVPSGTPIEHWNNMILTATSDKCLKYTSTLVLFTFIPDPDKQ